MMDKSGGSKRKKRAYLEDGIGETKSPKSDIYKLRKDSLLVANVLIVPWLEIYRQKGFKFVLRKKTNTLVKEVNFVSDPCGTNSRLLKCCVVSKVSSCLSLGVVGWIYFHWITWSPPDAPLSATQHRK